MRQYLLKTDDIRLFLSDFFQNQRSAVDKIIGSILAKITANIKCYKLHGKTLLLFVFLTLIFAGKRCAFFSFSSYSHGADTHSAASAAFSSCSPVPAPSAFPENGSAYVPHKETAESHRRYVSRLDGRHAYIRLARSPEICGRVLHRLLLFLCRRSKADDPRRLRRNHKQRQQNQKHAKQPEKKQRNTAQYRKNGFACLALSVFHTGNLLRRQRIVLQHHILLYRIWTSDHSLKRCNIIQEPFVF